MRTISSWLWCQLNLRNVQSQITMDHVPSPLFVRILEPVPLKIHSWGIASGASSIVARIAITIDRGMAVSGHLSPVGRLHRCIAGQRNLS